MASQLIRKSEFYCPVCERSFADMDEPVSAPGTVSATIAAIVLYTPPLALLLLAIDILWSVVAAAWRPRL